RRFLTELSLSARAIGVHRGLPLVESAAVQGPVALGLLDRRIVVPADFETRYSVEERRLALDHESIHHRRGDIWWNHLGLLILALGSPGLARQDAQPQTQTPPPAATPARPQRREERIIIRTDHGGHTATTEHHGAAAGSTDRRERVIVMTHEGEGGHPAHGDH